MPASARSRSSRTSSDEQLTRVHSPIMSPLVWDLGHIAAYEDLWLAHRHGGPRAAAPRARRASMTRSRRPARSAARSRRSAPTRRARLPRARCASAPPRRSPSEGVGDGVICEMVCATSSSTPRRCARRWRSPACCPPASRRAIDATALAAGQAEWLEIPPGRSRWAPPADGFAYDNERPRHDVELPALRDRAPAGEQRELDALQRGRRLRAPRVVVATRAGRGRRSTTSPTIPALAAGDPEAPGVPRHLVRGRRLRPRARCAPAHRGRVGEGGDLDRSEGRRLTGGVGRGVGVDRAARSTATRASSPTPTASTRRCSSASDYRVLRGGSWATSPRVATPTFRNWDLPQRRQIFAGVRLARDRSA